LRQGRAAGVPKFGPKPEGPAIVFKNQGPRGAEGKQKKHDVPTYYLPFFKSGFENIFMVFLCSSCRETAKNAIQKNRWENTTGKKFFSSQLFRPKVFDMYFPQFF
jgi:hypothetical protein